nr:hypothetical protein [Tanacetum cinerariifolium]
MLMIECVIHTVKTDMVIHTAKTKMMKLMVKIECVGMNADAFDKETGSSDGLQPEQADLNCVHALNKPHLHEIHVVPKFKERMRKYTRFDAQSFKDAMICTMDSIRKYMLEIILHQQWTSHLLKHKKLMQTQEDHSNLIRALNVDSLKVDSVFIQNTCFETEDSNSETVSSKSVEESSLDSATKDIHAIKYKMSKAKERCMTYCRSLHSHLQVLSKEDLKGTRIEHGFKRAFMSLFGQDADTFTSTMLLNVDRLQKQLVKDEFKEDGSMTVFWVTGIMVKHFRDTLLQHMGNVKKSVVERTRHQRQHDRRVNKRLMQTQESKIDSGKAVNDNLVVTNSSGTESEVHDDNSRSGNDTNADDADIKPIYDQEPMAESLEFENSLLKETVAQFQKDFSRMEAHSIALELKYQNQALKLGQHGQILNGTSNKAKIKKEIDVLETINIELEYSVAKLRKENESLKKHYKDLYVSIKITRTKTIEHTTSLIANNADLKAQIQEKVFAIIALKNNLRKLKGNSVDTKFAKASVLGKPVLQPLRNQSVVRQPNAFKSERPQMSKQRFASQVDGNSFKNMPRFSSNDMVHNHYLDEAKKKTHKRDMNSKTSVMTPARFQSTTDDSKPKPRRTNHSSRSLSISKSSCEVNSRAKIQSHKTRDRNKPVDQKSHTQIPGRQIYTGHRFSPNKTSDVYEKTSPRSDLRWKPTGRIFKSVGLRWIPTGKLFDSCISKVDSEPPHGSNVDISKIHECKQTLDLSACTSINVQKEQSLDLNAEIPSADMIIMTSMIELECIFDPTFDEYFNGENQVVSKPSAVTTADTSDKRQQQPDSTSSTLTLATTVYADGNFYL